jgi:phosphoglycolate phosphatase-like HAD superfamily hydrolase
MLVLFDLAGTLLLDDGGAHDRALASAARDVYGIDVDLPADPRATDRGRLRAALRDAGVDDGAVDARFSAWRATATEDFARAGSAGWVPRDGLRAGLERLREGNVRLGLATGDLEGIAAAKVLGLGVADLIDARVGGFGSDTEDRADLVALGRARAGGWPAERTLVVGAQPADAAAARAAGAGAVLFVGEHVAPEDADAVVADMPALIDLLVPWRGD